MRRSTLGVDTPPACSETAALCRLAMAILLGATETGHQTHVYVNGALLPDADAPSLELFDGDLAKYSRVV